MAENPAKWEFSNDYNKNTAMLDDVLKVNENFDIVTRVMDIGGRKGKAYFIDGFLKDDVFEKIMSFLMNAKPEDVKKCKNVQQFIEKIVNYGETQEMKNVSAVIDIALAGAVILMVEGYAEAVVIDARLYPIRDVKEPENDRVLRGSRDGFVETLVYNAALLRRRIRDRNFVLKLHQVGNESKSDVVVCYMDNKVDKELLDNVERKIESINLGALTFNQESLMESLVKRQWYNPFPKVRYTERPDTAVSNILEGKIIILVDNSPAAMIIPTFFLDFLQETNDFYFPPLIGSYLKIVRIIIYAITLFLIPVWFCLISNEAYIPPGMDFIRIKSEPSMPIILQLLIIELLIECMRIASLNTPLALSNSFSVIGTLILGEFGVQSRWFVPEAIFFMAFVAISNYTQPSFELGYAFKLFRIFMIVLIDFFNVWGFAIGLFTMIMVLATTKTVSGRPYTYPLIPFDGKALKDLFIRERIKQGNN